MSDIEELIKLEPYKSCYEYGEIKGRADGIDEFLKAKEILEGFFLSKLQNKAEKILSCLPKCNDMKYKCDLSQDDCFECMAQALDKIEEQLKE